ncbi:MAG: S10 family serine carboxypeptidase-like protein, partial [Flammeovirgaceae bacterium]
LLNNNVQVLVYSGDKDFVCNWRGGEAWTNSLNWNKTQEFRNQNYTLWFDNNRAVGEFKAVDNLTFLRVYDAGHMVPMDQPEVALRMLNNFINQPYF